MQKDFGTTGQVRPIPNRRLVLVKILSAASGGGKYNGILVPAGIAAVPASGTLNEGDFGNITSSTADCLVLNGPEVAQSTHDLTTGTPVSKIFPGVLLPMRSTTGLYVVAINGFDWKVCT